MERRTPVRKPHDSTADLLTWSDSPPSGHPSSAVNRSAPRSHQPSDGITKVVFGGQITAEEAEGLNKTKDCSGYKLKEMTGSGIFSDNDNGVSDIADPTNRTGLRHYQQTLDGVSQVSFSSEGTVSPKKPTSLPEVAKQRELSGTLQTDSDTKNKQLSSSSKIKEISGNDIFGPPPEILPRSLAAAHSHESKESKDIEEPAPRNVRTSVKVSNPAGGHSNILFGEEPESKTSKKIHDQKFQELSGNGIFRGDSPHRYSEKQQSSAKLREMSGSDIFADGKAEHREHFGGCSSFSSSQTALSPSPNLDITIEECSTGSEQLLEEDRDELGISSNDPGIEENDIGIEGNNPEIHNTHLENDCDSLLEIDGNDHGDDTADIMIDSGEREESLAKSYMPPFVGMEFGSYDDAYNYYNSYAGDLGFAIRVKSSWTKRNSKEKRGAVLCCNCEGFKTIKEANTRRKETRTGCLAMIRLRLVESNRWRVDEFKVEHNHLFDLERAQNSKSHKRTDSIALKRKVEPTVAVEVQTIKLYRTSTFDLLGLGTTNLNGEAPNHAESSRRLELKKGDAQVIQDFFSRVQLTNPNFLYLMDLDDNGCLKNVFWMESRSRTAYPYFSDVVAFDTTCLSNKFEIPLVGFIGVNHHGESILFGCGLVGDQTFDTYVWLFRAWLTCLSGRPPKAIITDQCEAIQTAISEVFSRTHHHLCLNHVMQTIFQNVIGLPDPESFHMLIDRIVYASVKIEEFEMAWEDMILRFGLANHEFLRSLYEDRERWVPIYQKDTFFAGMLTFHQDNSMISFFNGYIHQNTSLKDFFDVYQSVLETKYNKEAVNDSVSRHSSLVLKTRCPYEAQISKLYTSEIFQRFQDEVVMMSSCFGITQVHSNGPLITYTIKEQEVDTNERQVRSFEVMYDISGAELRCICGCFNLNGYLCRHALSILNYNGVENIPYQYVLSRWRRDLRRLYLSDLGSDSVDITNPVQWYDHLYRKAIQVVEEGMNSQDHYTVAWQQIRESLNKIGTLTNKPT